MARGQAHPSGMCPGPTVLTPAQPAGICQAELSKVGSQNDGISRPTSIRVQVLTLPKPSPPKAPRGVIKQSWFHFKHLSLHSLQNFSKRCTAPMGRGKTCPQDDVCLRGELLLPHNPWAVRVGAQAAFPGLGIPQWPCCPPMPGQRASSCPRKHPVPDTSPVLRSKPAQSHLPLKHPSWTKQLLAGGGLAGHQPSAAPSHPSSAPSSRERTPGQG